ncbi:MAG: lamin tail domain-containing protein, partial [Massilia sp.]
MKTLITAISSPGRKTLLASVLAAALAGLAVPASAAPASVVISQVYGAGGNAGASYNRDFIELFNRSGVAQSLTGMSVQYQSATGTTWQATALPNVTLQPGQYFLVTGASGGAVGADVGTADQTGSLNLSGTTGKVALASQAAAMTVADGGGKIVDLVGFGTANLFETTVAPAPSNTTSIKRGGQGCVDTDNNGADFAAGLIDPRRSTSATNACGGPVVQPIVTDCPSAISTVQGSAASGLLKASDADSIVNAASISGGAVAGIALSGFAPAAAVGASASVSLDVGASVPSGSYAVVVNFSNGDAQSLSCTVSVKVAGEHTIPQIQG